MDVPIEETGGPLRAYEVAKTKNSIAESVLLDGFSRYLMEINFQVIHNSPTPPQYVFWYHNDRMINYDTARGGISVETIPGPRTQSRLTITDTNDADSGNYTCSASNTEPASIYVFVSEGDNVDAILSRKSCGICIASQLVLLIVASLTVAMR